MDPIVAALSTAQTLLEQLHDAHDVRFPDASRRAELDEAIAGVVAALPSSEPVT